MVDFAILLMIGGVLIAALGYFANESTEQGSVLARDVINMGGWIALIATAMLVVALVWPEEADAQETQQVHFCGPWSTVQKQFAGQHGEVPIGGGQVNATTVLQILVSPDGRTWSIFEVQTNGLACLRAAGVHWEPGILPKPRAKESRS